MEKKLYNIIVTSGGALASYLFGGWSALLGILLGFVVIDYATGFLAAAIEGELSSKTGLKGIAKKVCIFAVVAIANLIDAAMGNQHILRDATIFFYLSNELLSIIENVGRAGIPVPSQIQKAVKVLQGKENE
ncbi:phage holin family protein [Petroclostridium xylanilyticum]|uniref:phage holin family protein n=1 Tax=Petroclostridium xylanilyticum TaxID=1792311 RepID=UPI000B97EF94|nr:phage holin family protein [Petroclostridium xylanilyticum]